MKNEWLIIVSNHREINLWNKSQWIKKQFDINCHENVTIAMQIISSQENKLNCYHLYHNLEF